MPGLVAEVLLEAGAQVKAGDPVIVIEAMKLLQTINSPCDGELSAIHYSAGDTVEKNALLVTFSPEEIPQ
jgi:3-methylcrotonyl-CoA carboxylase alpha subunit